MNEMTVRLIALFMAISLVAFSVLAAFDFDIVQFFNGLFSGNKENKK